MSGSPVALALGQEGDVLRAPDRRSWVPEGSGTFPYRHPDHTTGASQGRHKMGA